MVELNAAGDTADQDQSAALQQRVAAAYAARQPLQIRGSGSRGGAFGATAQPLELAGHRGIVDYQPVELVLTARAGTPLAVLERQLAAQGQMLAFEPPRYGEQATLGGAIACGASGPARIYTGAARDFVLGCRMLNGYGERLRFGGQVMKNVAGFDLARLMCGARGTLGVLLELSLKVLPLPPAELAFELGMGEALDCCRRCLLDGEPISASAYADGVLRVRLWGPEVTLQQCQRRLGGETVPDGARYWRALRDHRLPFFNTGRPLWRLGLPLAWQERTQDEAPILALLEDPSAALLWEWGGQQLWLRSAAPAAAIVRLAQALGGHARRHAPGGQGVVTALVDGLDPVGLALHRRLKTAFDPAWILNPPLLPRAEG